MHLSESGGACSKITVLVKLQVKDQLKQAEKREQNLATRGSGELPTRMVPTAELRFQ